VQVFHVAVKLYLADTLHFVLYVEMVALFKQDRSMVYEDAIEHWVQSHLVKHNLWHYFMGQVVVDWVSHVVWSKVLFEAVLVDSLIFKGFYHYVETALGLIGVETYLEGSVTGTITSNLKLIVEHKVQNFFEKTKT